MVCKSCHSPAVFQCRACGVAYCAEHVEGLELCAGCTGKQHALSSASGWLAAVGSTVCVLGSIFGSEVGVVVLAIGLGAVGLRALLARRRRARERSMARPGRDEVCKDPLQAHAL